MINEYIVKLKTTSQQNFNATLSEAVVANRFVDLTDVSISGLNSNKNNYPVVYDSSSGKFIIVDPDRVLSAASSTTGPQPGLPNDFINTLDVDLDNKIDLDAGTF
jgi:hypothetical protein